MGLLTPGYFQSTYFAKDYWADDYWADYGLGQYILVTLSHGYPLNVTLVQEGA